MTLSERPAPERDTIRRRLSGPIRLLSNSSAAGPTILGGIGLGLVAVSAWHLVVELRALETLLPPVVAAALGIVPGLGLIALGIWLRSSEFSPRGRWSVAASCVAGTLLFGALMLASIAVRIAEGRPVGEPEFPLTIACATGGVAGALVGILFVRVRQSAAAAERAEQNLAFVNDVFRHDVLNALTVIRGQAELLPDDQADAARSIVEQTERLQGLTERTNALLRTLGDETDTDLDPIAVSSVLRSKTAELDRAYNSVTVEADVADDLAVQAHPVFADVVWNLLTNAVEHNHRSDPHVWVTATREADVVRLVVADDGPGIPAADRRHLFEETTARENSTGGFGLFFVSRMIEAWGGSITVGAREPRGTRFVVELPAADESALQFS